MCEQDHNLFRWGLHLLQVDLPSSSGYCGTTNQNFDSVCGGVYVSDSSYGANGTSVQNDEISSFSEDVTSVQNDEIIAHALQEELSHIAIAEASRTSHAGHERLDASFLGQNWLVSSANKISGNSLSIEVIEDIKASSSYPSPSGKLQNGEECLIEFNDDFYVLDGEVCRRLNQMTPVPV